MKKYLYLLFLIFYVINLFGETYTVYPFKNLITNKYDLDGKKLSDIILEIDSINFIENDISKINNEMVLKKFLEDNYEPDFKIADNVITGEYYYKDNMWNVTVKIINVKTKIVKTIILEDTTFSGIKNLLKNRIVGRKSYKEIGKDILKNLSSKYDIDMAIMNLLKSIEIEGGDWEVFFLLGEIYKNCGNYTAALYNYDLSLKFSEKNNQKVDSLISIGLLYKLNKDYKNALKINYDGLNIVENKYQKAVLLNNIGNIYCILDDIEKAKKVWNEALLYADQDLKNLIKSNLRLVNNLINK